MEVISSIEILISLGPMKGEGEERNSVNQRLKSGKKRMGERAGKSAQERIMLL